MDTELAPLDEIDQADATLQRTDIISYAQRSQFCSEVAETECETSNRVLEILEEWNDYLKNNVSYYQEPSP